MDVFYWNLKGPIILRHHSINMGWQVVNQICNCIFAINLHVNH